MSFQLFVQRARIMTDTLSRATRDEEGFYAIVDRKKELIKYKGWQGAFFAPS